MGPGREPVVARVVETPAAAADRPEWAAEPAEAARPPSSWL